MLREAVGINLIVFLHLIYSQIEINFHLTQLMTIDDNIVHDCLYIPIPFPKEYKEHQLLSFCLSQLPSKFQMKPNHLDSFFTFDQLADKNVTTEQLYRWSASIDLIEQYQFYLNDRKSLLGNETFYNCTLPYFGSQCQYIFKDLNYSKSSLTKMLEEYYFLNAYEPMLFTCYQHLECNRGPNPICLDWTEICDGKIDCLNEELDEKNCWKFDIVDPCDEKHHQCENGHCISKIFKGEYRYSFDCVDQSDEGLKNHLTIRLDNDLFKGPIFAFEDVSCLKLNSYFRERFITSCIRNRQKLILYAMFSMKPSWLSDECWTAFKCLIQVPILNSTICKLVCHNGFCYQLLKTECPDLIYVSASPVLYSHVNLIMNKNDLINNWYWYWYDKPPIKYICYDHRKMYVDETNIDLFSLNNQTCFNATYISRTFFQYNDDDYHWLELYSGELNKWFAKTSVIIKNNLWIYTNSNSYKCQNWPKYIPRRQVNNFISDCLYGDDERQDAKMYLYNCSSNIDEHYFHCKDTNKCFLKKYVNDGNCDCFLNIYTGGCIDEDKTFLDSQYESLFQQICDGYGDVEQPLTGTYRVYFLDEQNCQYWPLVHVYTHCDGYFDTNNGLDEVNCDPSLSCPSNHHLCISQQTHQFICLSINKINDGIDDCIGGYDEPNYCYKNINKSNDGSFFCGNNLHRTCIPANSLCHSKSFCMTNNFKEICQLNNHGFLETSIDIYSQLNCTDFAQFLCKQFTNIRIKQNKKFFTLDQRMNLNDEQLENDNIINTPSQLNFFDRKSFHQRCHRGLDLKVYLDKEKNITTDVCLCPPSFYGSQCQYQNERISLTLQIRSSSDSIQIPFRIFISLIDNSQQRIIHFNEQITYISSKDCEIKYHFYLLYSTRPKDQSKEYFIHIDIYEKLTLKYRSSFIKKIEYSFLPVHRLVYQLDIPSSDDSILSCSDRICKHGKCIRYANELTNQSFCQCERGWSGESCTIKYDCQCSSDALCLGQLANNRSLCVCPLNREGSKCLIQNKICSNEKCLNRGQCVSYNDYDKRFICICQKDYSNNAFCQINQTKLILSFNENIHLPSTIFIHFIEVKNQREPYRLTIIRTIYPGQQSTTIRWSLPFHLVFVQFDDQTYYLALMQKLYNHSLTIKTMIQSSDRCLSIKELFNETITNSRLISRIKYYHLPCQQIELNLQCFYDDIQLCLCQQVSHYRVANCFKFNHKNKSNCKERNACKNGGICYQEDTNCSRISICQCLKCFYGPQCELTTNSFNLSLDAILAFSISPNLSLKNQSLNILICLCLAILVVLLGLINVCCSLLTFKNVSTRQSGCGIYLLYSSILSFWILVFFFLKFLIVILSQMGIITNQLFLNIQCYSLDYIIRCILNIEQWLTSFVAIERAIITVKGVHFQQQKAKFVSKWIVFCSILFTIITNIHDPLYRKLFKENDDEQQRYWCIVEYPSIFLRIYNSFINIFHFILPFSINLISAILIISFKTKQQIIIQRKRQNQRSHLKIVLIEQIQKHQNLLIAPCMLTLLGIPRLIISFQSSCMTSNKDFWFYLSGYYISFIPSLLTFIIFVLPSSTYKRAFRTEISRLLKKANI